MYIYKYDATAYKGSSAEAGDPDEETHPFAPKNSRAFGDPYVHCITGEVEGYDVIQFWFPKPPQNKIMLVDFVLLEDCVYTGDDELERLENQNAVELIRKVYFEEYCMDYYKDKISGYVFRNLNDGEEIECKYDSPFNVYIFSWNE